MRIVFLMATAFVGLLPTSAPGQQQKYDMEQARQVDRTGAAEKNLRAAIRDARKSGGQDLRLAESLDKLALLYRDEKKYQKSEALYRRSLAIKEVNLGPWDLGVAAGLDNLASVIASQGRHDMAERFYRRAHEIRDQALATHPDVYVNGVRKEIIPPPK